MKLIIKRLHLKFVYDRKSKIFYIKKRNFYNKWKYVTIIDYPFSVKYSNKSREKLLNIILITKFNNKLIKYKTIIKEQMEIIDINDSKLKLRNKKIKKLIHNI